MLHYQPIVELHGNNFCGLECYQRFQARAQADAESGQPPCGDISGQVTPAGAGSRQR
ncbi:DUF3330 domain-containing protein [Burkholderia cenocepacia]|uniref:DUF3330 domain-containing protein n=1 Tax=Burkholderia cenocepacia TaxID=95486 RepID=UPI00114CDA94|nr:DUF3330 domain-containing protein [Burkholderia cenocepacia]